VDIDELQQWVGKQERHTDLATQAPVTGLSATLDYPQPRALAGDPIPNLWHWLYFLPAPAASQIDVDGHPLRGGFLPPVDLPRRMWAGSKLRFVSPVCVGDEIEKVSTIKDISLKSGSSGALVFVTVQHEILVDDRVAIVEEQNLVYRQRGSSNSPPGKPAPAVALWSREITPDPVLLFRYSALTHNSHRIHYDRDYATDVEGYFGLVVQGPLTAILLLDLLRREMPGVEVKSFEFRGVRPLLDIGSFSLQGRCDRNTAKLWALDSSGALAMTATALLL
jgi:3-methylfumaryl-CoA hydratase